LFDSDGEGEEKEIRIYSYMLHGLTRGEGTEKEIKVLLLGQLGRRNLQPCGHLLDWELGYRRK
jgi:hypothetical protein